MMGRPYKYFEQPEFYCKCNKCAGGGVSSELISMLDKARGIAGVPFRVTSGYRCEDHNRRVGGVGTSSHTLGLAVDIACGRSDSRWKIVDALIEAGFSRIGIASGFIHVDVDPKKPAEVMWVY